MRCARVSWRAVALVLCAGIVAACGANPPKERYIDVRHIQVVVEPLVAGAVAENGVERPGDEAALHPAVYEYLFTRPELPFVTEPNDPDQLAVARESAAAAWVKANNELLATGGVNLKIQGEGGLSVNTVKLPDGMTAPFTILASRLARIVIVRTTVSKAMGVGYLDYALDLADLPEAFDPTARLTAEDVARRGRFLKESL